MVSPSGQSLVANTVAVAVAERTVAVVVAEGTVVVSVAEETVAVSVDIVADCRQGKER